MDERERERLARLQAVARAADVYQADLYRYGWGLTETITAFNNALNALKPGDLEPLEANRERSQE